MKGTFSVVLAEDSEQSCRGRDRLVKDVIEPQEGVDCGRVLVQLGERADSLLRRTGPCELS